MATFSPCTQISPIASRRILRPGVGVDDPHRRCARWTVADQLGAAAGLVLASFGMAGRQLLIVEADGLGRSARLGCRDVHRCLGEAVGWPDRRLAEVEAGEPIREPLKCAAWMRSLPLMIPTHVAEVEPGHVVVRCPPYRQFEREIRCGRERTGDAARATASIAPAAAGMPSGSTGQRCVRHDRRTDAEDQTHVVIEGQPRHHRGVGGGPPGPEVVGRSPVRGWR